MFRHLDKFSNTAATTFLSVQVAQAPGPEQIPDLVFQPGSHQEQERAQSLAQTSAATENCQESLPVSDVSAGVGKVRSSSAADTNQGKMITGVFIAF